MLKTIPKNGKRFLGWYDGNGNKVSGQAVSTVKSQYIYTFKMKDAATQFTAVYEGGTAQRYEGDGKALTAFPTTTPKNLDDVTFVPITSDSSKQTDVEVDKNIKKFFDAFKPDSGNGFSENNHAGYTGEGFWNVANEKNSYGSYRMKFPGAGYTTLAVIYSNGGSTDRMFNAYLDHDYYVNAPSTGSWDKWDTAYVVMDAPMGEADLRFISLTADGGPNIDAFGFSLDDVCRVGEDCATTKMAETPFVASGLRLTGDVLSLTESAEVSVYDMRGSLVVRKSAAAGEVDLSSLVRANGLYRVMVRQGKVNYAATWAKVK